jgi:hypothetical protein
MIDRFVLAHLDVSQDGVEDLRLEHYMLDCVIAFYEKPYCPPFGKLCGVGRSTGIAPIYA